tara:strand:- start:699 stop:971 length:273 start_codon:yes stop_codon:yes gene_type:complete
MAAAPKKSLNQPQGLASEDDLYSLHRLVAQKLINQLNRDDVKASDLANAIKFLKDQGITALNGGDVSAISEMISELPEVDLKKVRSYIGV